MSDTPPPKVEPQSFIRIQGDPLITAIVHAVHSPTELAVIYIDARDRASSTHAVWVNDRWYFKPNDGADGSADFYTHMQADVRRLRTHVGIPSPYPPPRAPKGRARATRTMRRRR